MTEQEYYEPPYDHYTGDPDDERTEEEREADYENYLEMINDCY